LCFQDFVKCVERRPVLPNPRRDNHYTPKFHLRRFVDSTDRHGRIWVYDRTKPYNGQPKLRYPSQVAKEYDLYVRTGGQGIVDDALERWFSEEIDGPGVRAVAELILSGPGPLPLSSRRDIARFLAAQDLRTPAARDWINAELRGQNRSITDAETRDAWISTLRTEPEELALKVEQSGWKVIRAPDGVSFLTPDIGLVKVLKNIHSPVEYSPGWTDAAGGYRHWVFPLDPGALLFISPGIADGVVKRASPKACRAINMRILEQAHRYVFASHRDERVLRHFTGV
jgi:hypothetical protein